jgi:hypothetical protein
MSRGFEKGVIIFVTTSSLLVAKYFQTLNDGSKARTFKKLTDREKITCQKFGWSTKKRFEFLKVLNGDGNSTKVSEDLLQPLAERCFDQATTVREMDDALSTLARDPLRRAVPTRDEGEDNYRESNCTSCAMM